MSGGPKLRSMNVAADPETRPVLGPAGNKTRSVTATARKPISKPLRKADRAVLVEAEEEEEKKKKKTPARASDSSPPVSPSLGAPAVLRRQELLLRSNLSLNASCSSDCSTESFRSRSSTGRIGRPSLTSRRKNVAPKPEKIAAKLEKIVPDGFPESILQGKRRCAWITPNTDPLYAAFHDEEWGVPVHNDKKLFELLVLSGALAELTWPAILSKRHIFREVFMDFDPLAVSKLNERRITAPGSTASSLLSEPKLRAIIENAHQILKITEECGSFDRYCWSFVNYNPIISRFRYPRQIPVKTPKADVISKDLVRRGFRFVGPTVIYSFMQATGITNDHLINCFRFEECCVNEKDGMVNGNHKVEEKSFVATTGTGSDTSSSPTAEQKIVGIDLDLNGVMNDLGISG